MTKFFLDSENQALVDAIADSGLPPFEDLNPKQTRDAFVELQAHTPTPGIDLTEFLVEFGSKHGYSIRTILFRPNMQRMKTYL